MCLLAFFLNNPSLFIILIELWHVILEIKKFIFDVVNHNNAKSLIINYSIHICTNYYNFTLVTSHPMSLVSLNPYVLPNREKIRQQ